MAIREALLAEYDHEMALTRRLFERAPEPEFGWKPHEKSWSLGELATHLANIPTWTRAITDQEQFEMLTSAPGPPTTAVSSRAELLERFDQNVMAARGAIEPKSDAELLVMWTFKKDGHVVFTLPRIGALRGFVMNHSIHHRGQLSVYLRMRNVPLPAIYGASADEG